MNMYGGKVKIDGVMCSLIINGHKNGEYIVYFERTYATIEQIENINWRRPTLSGPCELPRGYGFEVKDIEYSMGTRTYHVTLQVREQYLGDVTGHQAQIAQLEEDKTRLESDSANLQDTIQQLTGQLAEADETAIELYEALEAALAEQEPEPEEPVEQEPVEQEPEHEEPEEVTEE